MELLYKSVCRTDTIGQKYVQPIFMYLNSHPLDNGVFLKVSDDKFYIAYYIQNEILYN